MGTLCLCYEGFVYSYIYSILVGRQRRYRGQFGLRLDVLIDNLHADVLCATLTLCDITKEIGNVVKSTTRQRFQRIRAGQTIVGQGIRKSAQKDEGNFFFWKVAVAGLSRFSLVPADRKNWKCPRQIEGGSRDPIRQRLAWSDVCHELFPFSLCWQRNNNKIEKKPFCNILSFLIFSCSLTVGIQCSTWYDFSCDKTGWLLTSSLTFIIWPVYPSIVILVSLFISWANNWEIGIDIVFII